MKKGELIGILRDYEHNYGALYSFYENSVKNAEALLKKAERLSLGALLAVLQDEARVFIVHRMGPNECEGVAGGTAQELRSTRCVEVCGDNVVERLTLDLDEWPEIWPSDDPAPVLVITIGGKAEISEIDRFSADVAYQPDDYDIRSLIAKHAQEC